MFVGWTYRETKIIDYLLRSAGFVPTIGATPLGALSILLSATCRYISAENVGNQSPTDWMFATRPISTVIVSNDLSLARLAMRGDMTNLEIKLMSFPRAFANPSTLSAEAVLLIDMSDDIAEVVRLLDQLTDARRPVPPLVAICPPGRMGDSLSERLLELGFKGVIQKPLHYSRLIDVVRATLTLPSLAASRGDYLDQPEEP